jgi:predicted HTH transcriptional regulator
MNLRYPHAPGHHGEDTSIAAAESMHDIAESDRAICLRAFMRFGAMTADECANQLNWSDVYRARRRVTELKQQGLLVDTQQRRGTVTGRKAAVLRARDL